MNFLNDDNCRVKPLFCFEPTGPRGDTGPTGATGQLFYSSNKNYCNFKFLSLLNTKNNLINRRVFYFSIHSILYFFKVFF